MFISKSVTMREAATRGDAQEIKTLAHTLKGSSANMGAHLMAKLGGKLEAQSRVNEDTEALITSLEKEFLRVRAVLEAERGTSGL